jgi:hypothetical protein
MYISNFKSVYLIVLQNVVGKYFSRYFNIGDGGNREGLAKKWKNQPEWSAFHKAAYGYARFDMYNSTHLQFSWISNEYETDEFYLSQGILTPMVKNESFAFHFNTCVGTTYSFRYGLDSST